MGVMNGSKGREPGDAGTAQARAAEAIRDLGRQLLLVDKAGGSIAKVRQAVADIDRLAQATEAAGLEALSRRIRACAADLRTRLAALPARGEVTAEPKSRKALVQDLSARKHLTAVQVRAANLAVALIETAGEAPLRAMDLLHVGGGRRADAMPPLSGRGSRTVARWLDEMTDAAHAVVVGFLVDGQTLDDLARTLQRRRQVIGDTLRWQLDLLAARLRWAAAPDRAKAAARGVEVEQRTPSRRPERPASLPAAMPETADGQGLSRAA